MFLHPIWHMGAMIGTYLAIQCIAAIKTLANGHTATIEWDIGVIPYTRAGARLDEVDKVSLSLSLSLRILRENPLPLP